MPYNLQVRFGDYIYDTNHAQPEKDPQFEFRIRNAISEVPRSNVAKAQSGFLGPRGISIRGVIGVSGGSDYDTMRDLVDEFNAAHVYPGYRKFWIDDDRYLWAEVESATIGGDHPYANAMPYAVRLICPDPYWHTDTVTGDTTWTSPVSNTSKSYGNVGSAPSDPIITLAHGGGTNVTIKIKNLGLDPVPEMILTGDLDAGDLVIDMGAKTIYWPTTILGVPTNVNRLDLLTSGDFFPLKPGTQLIHLFYSNVSISLVTVDYYQQWI